MLWRGPVNVGRCDDVGLVAMSGNWVPFVMLLDEKMSAIYAAYTDKLL